MSSSYRQTIEELKKIKKAQGGDLQNHQKPTFDPFDPFDGSSPGPSEKKTSAQVEHTWQGFYPNLAPADFEIVETAGGISGRKMKEDVAGTIGFFIPWKRLEKGPQPTTKRGTATATREEWDFSKIYIPSQTELGRVDVWMVGKNLNADELKWWFVRTEAGK